MVRTTTTAGTTIALGRAYAAKLKGGEVLALIGNLGAGKTTFVKGLAKGLGVRETITSPTFVLMKVYKAKRGKIKTFVHVDCYRVPGIELSEIGLTDYLGQPDTVVAIEWAKKLPRLPYGTTTITFTRPAGQPSARRILVEPAKHPRARVRREPDQRQPTALPKAARERRTRQRSR